MFATHCRSTRPALRVAVRAAGAAAAAGVRRRFGILWRFCQASLAAAALFTLGDLFVESTEETSAAVALPSCVRFVVGVDAELLRSMAYLHRGRALRIAGRLA